MCRGAPACAPYKRKRHHVGAHLCVRPQKRTRLIKKGGHIGPPLQFIVNDYSLFPRNEIRFNGNMFLSSSLILS